jgi:hypothetical protein
VLTSQAPIPDAGQHVVEVLEQEGDSLPLCHGVRVTGVILRRALTVLATGGRGGEEVHRRRRLQIAAAGNDQTTPADEGYYGLLALV